MLPRNIYHSVGYTVYTLHSSCDKTVFKFLITKGKSLNLALSTSHCYFQFKFSSRIKPKKLVEAERNIGLSPTLVEISKLFWFCAVWNLI